MTTQSAKLVGKAKSKTSSVQNEDVKLPPIGSPSSSPSNKTRAPSLVKPDVDPKTPKAPTGKASPTKPLPSTSPKKAQTPSQTTTSRLATSSRDGVGYPDPAPELAAELSAQEAITPPVLADAAPPPEMTQAVASADGSNDSQPAGNIAADVPDACILHDKITFTSEAAAAGEEPKAAAMTLEEEAEAQRVRDANGNGMVKLIYEQYDELFPIVDGSTTQSAIDEVYCLSFVMPNCMVRLSVHDNTARFERENTGIFDSLVREEPRGTYHDLVKDETYYVVVEQEADQLRRDQLATKAKWEPEIKQDKMDKDDGRGFESCSCIYGNPCVDEYGCKDWHSRFAVATANGWKGF